jgi:hypothetical protein
MRAGSSANAARRRQPLFRKRTAPRARPMHTSGSPPFCGRLLLRRFHAPDVIMAPFGRPVEPLRVCARMTSAHAHTHTYERARALLCLVKMSVASESGERRSMLRGWCLRARASRPRSRTHSCVRSHRPASTTASKLSSFGPAAARRSGAVSRLRGAAAAVPLAEVFQRRGRQADTGPEMRLCAALSAVPGAQSDGGGLRA